MAPLPRIFVFPLIAELVLQRIPLSFCARIPSRFDNDGSVTSLSPNTNNNNNNNNNNFDNFVPTLAPSKPYSTNISSTEPTMSRLRSPSTTSPSTIGSTTPTTKPSTRPEAATVAHFPSPSKNPTQQQFTFAPLEQPATDEKPSEPPASSASNDAPTLATEITTPTPIPTVASTDAIGFPTQRNQAVQELPPPTNAAKADFQKLVVMLASLVAVSGTMLALGIKHQKTRNRRSWEGSPSSNSPLV